MSRHDSDLDYYEWLNGPDLIAPNATCDDCGAEYAKAEGDPTTCCDRCSDTRDRWIEALEARRLAKAALTRPRTKEIA
jgi:hypothetical protein